jgi:hypothetical protein
MTRAPNPGAWPEAPWKGRWRQERSWTAKELAKLCCGWCPETGWDPYCGWDFGIPDSDESIIQKAHYKSAFEMVQRATRLGDLQPIALPETPTRSEVERGDAPAFAADAASAWATIWFPDTFALLETSPMRSKGDQSSPISNRTQHRTSVLKGALLRAGFTTATAFRKAHPEFTVSRMRAVITGDQRRGNVEVWTDRLLRKLKISSEDWDSARS